MPEDIIQQYYSQGDDRKPAPPFSTTTIIEEPPFCCIAPWERIDEFEQETILCLKSPSLSFQTEALKELMPNANFTGLTNIRNSAYIFMA